VAREVVREEEGRPFPCAGEDKEEEGEGPEASVCWSLAKTPPVLDVTSSELLPRFAFLMLSHFKREGGRGNTNDKILVVRVCYARIFYPSVHSSAQSQDISRPV
jgi:hypothetical protein